MGEGELDFKFLPAGGQFHLRGSDEALTPYGGLVAWDHFLERCGVIAELAANYPLPRTSPNATPVADILKAFPLNCLIGGTRFAHGRRLQDDEAVAKITGMHKGRLCGEDAFRRLCARLDASQVEAWFAPAEQMIHHAILPNAVADWDSTVIPRYGKQEDTAIGYNPQKPGRPSHHPLACVIALDQVTQPLITRYFADWIPMLEAIGKLLTPKSKEGLLINLFVIGLIAPICEELLFRGAFQGTLEQRGPAWAIACTVLAFGVIHLNPFNFLGPILFGVGMGLVVWRTGSILPAILWHALNNTVAVFFAGFVGIEYVPPWWTIGGLTVLFGLLLWEFVCYTRRSTPQLSPLSTTPAIPHVKIFRTIKLAGACAAILLVGSASCFGRTTVENPWSSEYATGDLIFYTKDFLREHISVGGNDVVTWKGAKTKWRNFARVTRFIASTCFKGFNGLEYDRGNACHHRGAGLHASAKLGR